MLPPPPQHARTIDYLQVNDLAEAPATSSDEEDASVENDELNKLILQELAQDEDF